MAYTRPLADLQMTAWRAADFAESVPAAIGTHHEREISAVGQGLG